MNINIKNNNYNIKLINIYEQIKSCNCWAKSQCFYKKCIENKEDGYVRNDCQYEYLQEEIPEWYYVVEPYTALIK